MKNRNKIIGERLKRARESLRYTQEQVAKKLNISRSKYLNIENGNRNIKLKDLYLFADLFNKPIEYFLREDVGAEDGFKILFRKTEGRRNLLRIMNIFEDLCEKMYELENILGVNYLPTSDNYSVEGIKDYKYLAKSYAEEIRRKLNLGDSPVENLEKILEEEYRLKIFYLPVKDKSNVYGMFTYSKKLGGCILVNSKPTLGNQLFSLAHEFAHFLFHKQELGIISSKKENKTYKEKLANYFAGNLLMPDKAVEKLFKFRIKDGRKIIPEDVLYIANYFGVSYKAMIYRLDNLGFLSKNNKRALENKSRITKIRKSLGISEQKKERSKFPPLYLHLCIKAYEKDKITVSKLAQFLEIPLYKAMEFADGLKKIG